MAAEAFVLEFGAGAGLLDDEPARVGGGVGEEEELFAGARVAEVSDGGGGQAAPAHDAVARGARPRP